MSRNIFITAIVLIIATFYISSDKNIKNTVKEWGGGVGVVSRNESAQISTSTHRHIDLAIGETTFKALVSDTDELRTRGLSGMSGLASNEAMLFVFENEGMWGFWMKDMNFPIDIVWLDNNKHVIHMEKNIAPDTYPHSFYPNTLSLYVIEFPAGKLDELGVKISDPVVFD